MKRYCHGVPHTSAVAYGKTVSSLNEQSLHFSKLWAGWDTQGIVIILECKYQTS